VSTVKKSTAMTLLACARRNSRHDGPLRLPAGPSGSSRRTFFTVVADTITQALQLPRDAEVAPSWIFACQPHDQCPNVPTDRRTTCAARVRPVIRHQTSVPAQKRGRRDEKRRPAAPRQHPARRCQEQSVGCSKRRPPNLPAQDRELVAQHDDLQFSRRRRPELKADQLEDTLKHDVARGNHGPPRKQLKRAASLRRPD